MTRSHEGPRGLSRVSLTAQIRYGLLIFTLLALLLTAGLLIQLSFRAQLAQIAVAHREQSRAAATAIDASLDDIQHKLGFLANVRGLADQPLDTQRSLIEGLARYNRAFDSVLLADARGTVFTSYAQSGATLLGDISQTPAFRRAFHDAQDYIGPVEADPEKGYLTVTLSVPVRDARDVVAGALVARVNLSFLSAAVAGARVGETGYIYVLDSRDQLIIERDSTLGADTVLNLAARSPIVPPEVDAAIPLAPYRGLYGDQVLGATAPVGKTGWSVVVEQPTAEAYAPLWQMLNVMGGALMGTLLLATVIGVIFSRRIVDPLRRLTTAAERMSAGDLGARVDIPAGSELGMLAHTFNTMTQRLGRLFSEQAARAEAEAAQRRFAFLAEASATLGASLDYEVTLGNLARLVVPRMADWCTIDTLVEGGGLRRMGAAHRDPARVAILWQLADEYPLDGVGPHPVAQVIETGRAAVLATIDDAQLRGMTRDERHLTMLEVLGTRSALVVPLRSRGKMLGTISFVSHDAGRYSERDLAMAQDLAQRAATAVDNALLYHEARQAIQARDEFLSVASHELKTPLTSVLGNAQLLDRRTTRSGSLSEREGRSVRVIVDQVVRLNRLIDALLDIGRIERGQLTIQREPVDLGALVRRVTAEFQPALERHELHCIVVGEPLVIDGDELRLEQVLQNLLQNAVKYSPEGGPLEVRAEPCGVQVCVAVADQGLGIPPDAIPHLFDRFYRAGNTRRQQLAGLGIGLFVVREIVTLHGGTIEVASREGQGSVFTVHLPLAADVLATDSPSNASRRAGQAPH